MLRIGDLILFQPRLGKRKWGSAVFSFVWRREFFHFWNRNHKGELILFERHYTDLLELV